MRALVRRAARVTGVDRLIVAARWLTGSGATDNARHDLEHAAATRLEVERRLGQMGDRTPPRAA